VKLKTTLYFLSVSLAIALYIPLLIGIWKDGLKQSFATWLLWVALDTIALLSILAQDGENYKVLVSYVRGGVLVTISLMCKKQTTWTRRDTAVVLLVIDCLVVWYQSGPKWATVASTIAVCISGIPQIVESNSERDRKTGIIYSGYVVVNTLYFLSGEKWSIEDKFYPAMMIPLCATIAWVSFRKKPEVTHLGVGEKLAT
jgi:hypothetical protein